MTGSVGVAWLQFFVCALTIAVAGSRLSRYGDIIADKTGLSRNWVGVVLLATVTSLPELMSGFSAVALAGVPDIAVGNALGASMANLLMLVLADVMYRPESLYRGASRGHLLSAGFGLMLLGTAALGLLARDRLGSLAIGHVGIVTPLIFMLYALAIRTLTAREKSDRIECPRNETAAGRPLGISLRRAVIGYALAAIIVVAAGITLPFVGSRLAQAMGWGGTFVGTLFISAVTTLPELAVTISSLRIGALDLAVGNLLGSSLFNVFILAVDDLFFLPGPLLTNAAPFHALSALSAMLMTGIAMTGLLFRPAGRVLGIVGWTSLGLSAVYILTFFALYRYGA